MRPGSFSAEDFQGRLAYHTLPQADVRREGPEVRDWSVIVVGKSHVWSDEQVLREIGGDNYDFVKVELPYYQGDKTIFAAVSRGNLVSIDTKDVNQGREMALKVAVDTLNQARQTYDTEQGRITMDRQGISKEPMDRHEASVLLMAIEIAAERVRSLGGIVADDVKALVELPAVPSLKEPGEILFTMGESGRITSLTVGPAKRPRVINLQRESGFQFNKLMDAHPNLPPATQALLAAAIEGYKVDAKDLVIKTVIDRAMTTKDIQKAADKFVSDHLVDRVTKGNNGTTSKVDIATKIVDIGTPQEAVEVTAKFTNATLPGNRIYFESFVESFKPGEIKAKAEAAYLEPGQPAPAVEPVDIGILPTEASESNIRFLVFDADRFLQSYQNSVINGITLQELDQLGRLILRSGQEYKRTNILLDVLNNKAFAGKDDLTVKALDLLRLEKYNRTDKGIEKANGLFFRTKDVVETLRSSQDERISSAASTAYERLNLAQLPQLTDPEIAEALSGVKQAFDGRHLYVNSFADKKEIAFAISAEFASDMQSLLSKEGINYSVRADHGFTNFSLAVPDMKPAALLTLGDMLRDFAQTSEQAITASKLFSENLDVAVSQPTSIGSELNGDMAKLLRTVTFTFGGKRGNKKIAVNIQRPESETFSGTLDLVLNYLKAVTENNGQGLGEWLKASSLPSRDALNEQAIVGLLKGKPIDGLPGNSSFESLPQLTRLLSSDQAMTTSGKVGTNLEFTLTSHNDVTRAMTVKLRVGPREKELTIYAPPGIAQGDMGKFLKKYLEASSDREALAQLIQNLRLPLATGPIADLVRKNMNQGAIKKNVIIPRLGLEAYNTMIKNNWLTIKGDDVQLTVDLKAEEKELSATFEDRWDWIRPILESIATGREFKESFMDTLPQLLAPFSFAPVDRAMKADISGLRERLQASKIYEKTNLDEEGTLSFRVGLPIEASSLDKHLSNYQIPFSRIRVDDGIMFSFKVGQLERPQFAKLESVLHDFDVNPVELRDVPEEIKGTAELAGTNGWRTSLSPDGDMFKGKFNLWTVSRMAYAWALNIVDEVKTGDLQKGDAVVVGFDNRSNGNIFAQIAARVIKQVVQAYGIKVIWSTSATTSPAMIRMTNRGNADRIKYGFLITASHNAPTDNGIKFYKDGVVSPDTQAVPVTASVEGLNAIPNLPVIDKFNLQDNELDGKVDSLARTGEHYKKVFQTLGAALTEYKQKTGIELVVDQMHGSSGGLADDLRSLGLDIVEDRTLPMSEMWKTEDFRNRRYNEAGKGEVPFRPEPKEIFLSEKYQQFKKAAAVGSLYMAIDGDADRLAVWIKVADGKTMEVAPNDLGVLYGFMLVNDVLNKDYPSEGAPKTFFIDKTQPTTTGMDLLVQYANKKATEQGKNVRFELKVTPVGSKNFAGEYQGGSLLIGVEESGHIVINDFFDDAVGQLHFLLQALSSRGRSLVDTISQAKAEIGSSFGVDLNTWSYDRVNPAKSTEFDKSFLGPFAQGRPDEALDMLKKELGEEKSSNIVRVTMTTLNPDFSTGDVSMEEYVRMREAGNAPKIKPAEGMMLSFKDGSWLMIRVSGTEGLVRVYAEAPNKEALTRMKMAVKAAFGVDIKFDAAQAAPDDEDAAELSYSAKDVLDRNKDWKQGGIDLNAANMSLNQQGQAMDMQFDPAVLEQFRRGDFTGIAPVILNIAPIQSLRPLLGMDDSAAGSKPSA
ncbi:MAG: hypothetical protein HGA80_04770 [Candidatus Omnitrophica bacterium]|nr:hypothetical protein [Candidatus Omnitrophota bacterium]